MGYIHNTAIIDEKLRRYGLIDNYKNINNSEFSNSEFLTYVYKNYYINYPKFYKMDRFTKISFLTTEISLQNNNLQLDNTQTAVVFFNNAASMETDINFQKTISDSENFYPSPSLFVYTLPNITTGEICIRNDFKGESAFYVLEKPDYQIFAETINQTLTQNQNVVFNWTDFDGNYQKSLSFIICNNLCNENSDFALKFDAESIAKIFDKSKFNS